MSKFQQPNENNPSEKHFIEGGWGPSKHRHKVPPV